MTVRQQNVVFGLAVIGGWCIESRLGHSLSWLTSSWFSSFPLYIFLDVNWITWTSFPSKPPLVHHSPYIPPLSILPVKVSSGHLRPSPCPWEARPHALLCSSPALSNKLPVPCQGAGTATNTPVNGKHRLSQKYSLNINKSKLCTYRLKRVSHGVFDWHVLAYIFCEHFGMEDIKFKLCTD
jgi:hypothetical protein